MEGLGTSLLWITRDDCICIEKIMIDSTSDCKGDKSNIKIVYHSNPRNQIK
jgi:hypothetical protein